MRRAKLGFIGVGAMGGPMALNLVAAGYPVCAFDRSADRLEAAAASGVSAAASVAGAVEQSDWILISLPNSSSLVELARKELLPMARPGQIFIDLGTTVPQETRALAEEYSAVGATFLDVPVSGGPGGAKRGDLYMFAGGAKTAVDEVMRLLKVLGASDRITYCGPSGSGQIVKGVNQLMMGLADAAYLEAISYGTRAGVDAEILATALGCEGRRRADYSYIAEQVRQGRGRERDVKLRELPYFLKEAKSRGFPLPLTRTLVEFCSDGEAMIPVPGGHTVPSFWNELLAEAEPAGVAM